MKSKVAFRRKAKHLSYRKRHLSLSSIEQVRLKRLKKIILALFCKIGMTDDTEEKKDLNDMLEAVVLKYLSIVVVYKDDMDMCERYDRTISSFSPSDCKTFFEFKKADLVRLFPLLNIPEICKFDNRSEISYNKHQSTLQSPYRIELLPYLHRHHGYSQPQVTLRR